MDSRKRPLDSEGEEESESGVIKKSNPGSIDHVHCKILIPSVAAGAIIGKGGEAVGKLQQDTGTKIKMSKAQEFYPGTHDRICLIVGSVPSILDAFESIMGRIRAKPDNNPKPEMDGKVNLERHKQAKVLITNSSAGMVIGKGGNYIREIKEKAGAYVQVSQKSRDPSMVERVVTVSGEESQVMMAMEMILQKIADDPQNGSYPTLTYPHQQGPHGAGHSRGMGRDMDPGMGPGHYNQGMMQGGAAGGFNSGSMNIGSDFHNLNLGSMVPGLAGEGPGGRGAGGGPSGMALANLKGVLHNSGYTEAAAQDIAQAMSTLANYGLLGLGLGSTLFGNLMNLNKLSIGGNAGASSGGPASGASGNEPPSLLGAGGDSLLGGFGGKSRFGPVGSSEMRRDGPNNGGLGSLSGLESMYGGGVGGKGPFSAQGGPFDSIQNKNSFGLGMDSGPPGPTETEEMEVSEGVVGSLIGQGGRNLQELQASTGATIQISKKGEYAPGTRNRIIYISGPGNVVTHTVAIIRQRVTDAEARRNSFSVGVSSASH